MYLPNNVNSPFFAYVIFDPRQLCFTRIEDIVQEYIRATINVF